MDQRLVEVFLLSFVEVLSLLFQRWQPCLIDKVAARKMPVIDAELLIAGQRVSGSTLDGVWMVLFGQ